MTCEQVFRDILFEWGAHEAALGPELIQNFGAGRYWATVWLGRGRGALHASETCTSAGPLGVNIFVNRFRVFLLCLLHFNTFQHIAVLLSGFSIDLCLCF